jgi:hypothetical protein
VVVASGEDVSLPDVAFAPAHPPDAVQFDAFVDVQVNEVGDPAATEVGLAVSVTVGVGTTVTVTDWLSLPPLPVHESVYVVVADSAGVACVPFVALAPVQPPEAMQLVAFVELQVSIAVPPFAMLVGLALNVTVGVEPADTVTLWLALPPVPLHVSVNVVAAARVPVAWVPETLFAPVQPPEAVQLVAFVEFQVSVDALPLATAVGLAVNVTVGAGVIVTVTLCAAVPPAPLQLSV